MVKLISLLQTHTYTLTPTSGVYKFSRYPVFEGTLVTFKYTADSTDVDQRFIIPSVNADTSTLKVSIQNSASDTTTSTYTLATGITSISATSKVYFLQEMEDGKFEIYFGDDVLGNKLDDGNIVILEYIVSNKDEANGASSFTLSGNVGGFSDVTLTTVQVLKVVQMLKQKNQLDSMHLYNIQHKIELLQQLIMKLLYNQYIQMLNQFLLGVVKMMRHLYMV